jgi:hypothetical protein
LRTVTIHLDKERVLPGETVSGQITIRTDRSFECNRVVLKITGKERTERSAGETKVSEERYHISRVFRISEGGIIPEGVTRLPFSFALPSSLPPSYLGYNGSIQYSIQSVVEVNWALDPACREPFIVLQERPPSLLEVSDARFTSQTSGHLHVQLDSNLLWMYRGISVRFMVSERSRVRGVRFEIIKREDALCQGHSMVSHTTILRRFYPISPSDFESWKEVRIGEAWDQYIPFRGDLISISYFLKISLDVSLGLNPDVVVPLQFSDDVPVGDVLDDIESDLWPK